MVDYAEALSDYPHLVEVVGGHVAKAGYDYDSEFTFGLDVILDRLEQLLANAERGVNCLGVSRPRVEVVSAPPIAARRYSGCRLKGG